jgi:hypothetical protein
MNKVTFCYSVYNAKKDLVGQPCIVNGMFLIDVGETYHYVYTADWQVLSFI